MTIRRTIYGAVEQTSMLLGCPVPVNFVKESSLNKTLGIEPDTMPSPTERTRLQMFTIGIGSHSYTTGVDGISLPTNKNHLATDANLFKMLAMCIREVGDDLPEATRQRYAMRRVETINGQKYIVYYGYRFDASTAVIEPLIQTIENGRITQSDVFVPTLANREPVPVDTSSIGTNLLTGQVVRASAPVVLALDAAAVAEILNAAVVRYGSEDYAYVSEIALWTCANRIIQSDNGNATNVAFNEAIAAEVYCHIPAQISMKDRRPGTELTYNVGGIEPLYVNG